MPILRVIQNAYCLLPGNSQHYVNFLLNIEFDLVFRLSSLDYEYRTFPTSLILSIFNVVMIKHMITWPGSHNMSTKVRVPKAIVDCVKDYAMTVCDLHGKETYYELETRIRKRITSGSFKVFNIRYNNLMQKTMFNNCHVGIHPGSRRRGQGPQHCNHNFGSSKQCRGWSTGNQRSVCPSGYS